MLNKKNFLLPSLFSAALLTSCGLSPTNVDVDINKTLPEAKATVYSHGIRKLGMLGDIFARAPLNVMSKQIADNTGTSTSTGGEVPRNITEMVNSTLNAIGGTITYVPYDPDFIANNMNVGYSGFENKTIPDVIVAGGITEFDRGLVTKGSGTNLGFDIGEYGVDVDDNNKGSLSQVTLDFNLLHFQKLAAIPRIQSINSIKLHKSIKDDSIAFNIKGVTFGAKGDIKKIQGRHAAVRLLVQLSMIQLVGRYQKTPYWNLLPGMERDEVVLDAIKIDFSEMTPSEQIQEIQTLLYLHNFPVDVTGQENASTTQALQQFASKNGLKSPGVNIKTYVKLFETIPINIETKIRRNSLGKMATRSVNIAAPSKTPKSPAITKGDLKVWTNKKSYVIGEKMTVSFSVKNPMYVRIVWINSKGEISTLFPNPFQTDNYMRPGQTYQIPPVNAEFSVDIGAPTGVDKIRAVGNKNGVPADALFFTNTNDFDAEKMKDFPVRYSTEITIK
ncbi:MAG: DUF4384 domain-containing protein [Methylococcales bacterium]|nr:DUF4384 domain-containing protein [Methylococcales bacterium]MCK5897638.1 DUF4384 domain-containing protein [Methylococcales bacterium]